MQNRYIRPFLLLLVLGVTLSLCLVDANAQKSTKKRSRRTSKPVVTNPQIDPPADGTNGDAKIVSTADENSADVQDPDQAETAPAKKAPAKKRTASEQEQMQQTIKSLSTQVERLNDKLSQMQESDKTLLDMERLTRAEQRAEGLRSQLVDVEGKLADLQARLDQIVYSLKPENIERSTAGYGTVHPEDLRDTRKKQLENEKGRVEAQVRILETSRARLEGSLVTADAEVDRLRRRLETREQQEILSGSADTDVEPSNGRKPPE